MILLLVFHVVVALGAAASADRIGRRSFWLAALAPAATVAWVVARGGPVLDGEAHTERVGWISQLSLDVSFRVDAFSLLMLGVIGGIGVLVMVYAGAYFDHPPDGLGRFVGLLVAFTGAMTGLVVADDFYLIFVFWELTSITSFGLIGFNDRASPARAAALQALLITAAGGLVLMAGLVLLQVSTGAASLSELAAAEVVGSTASWAAVLILIGCFTKSAQVPFHGWLPGAMAAPTPVSAYLHSATMVKAGVFLLARLSPHLADLPPWRPMAVGVGLVTMAWGGWRALKQNDLKLLLAYSTVSQLGMLTATFGVGEPKLLFAGTALLVAHAVFKASLFMVVGIIDHSVGTRDIHELTGVGRRMPVTALVALIGGASMAGLIPLYGFVAKEVAVAGFLESGLGLGSLAVAAFVAASSLTAAYTLRFLWGAFSDRGARHAELEHPPTSDFVVPALLLAVPSVLFGALPSLAETFVGPAAEALDLVAGAEHLHLWPGLNLALGVSTAAVVAGVLLFVARRPVERGQQRLSLGITASELFQQTVTGTVRAASRFTGVVQNGSLPLYLGVIMVVSMVGPLLVVTGSLEIPADREIAASGLQVVTVALVMGASLGLALTRRRFVAVLLLGGVGFGVASMFMIQGAPDLALTQVLVETVAVAVFVLVLRHLPARFERAPLAGSGVPRVVAAAIVGITVFAISLTAIAARSATPVDVELAERALPDGDGRNIVNVILVDIRGLDTVGEATVLVTAALGVVALVRAGRQVGSRQDEPGDTAAREKVVHG